jgi:hypothetical protein
MAPSCSNLSGKRHCATNIYVYSCASLVDAYTIDRTYPSADRSIAGSARVSSREQSGNSHALEQQIARLEAAWSYRDLCAVASVLEDRKELCDYTREIKGAEFQERHRATRIDRIADRSSASRFC